ncbi:MAG TPA: STAS domain-containing protein [Nitrospira sp.]|jgi:anti-anti-sigma factor|nr:STAS domain-containing protein [Nitrospira sp.]
MHISERRIGDVTILDLVGDLTYANRSSFKAAVERSKQAGYRHLIVNLQAVRFLDSSALGMLALLSQSMKASQGVIILSNPQSYIREILALAHLDRLLPIYNSEQEALAGEQLPAGIPHSRN